IDQVQVPGQLVKGYATQEQDTVLDPVRAAPLPQHREARTVADQDAADGSVSEPANDLDPDPTVTGSEPGAPYRTTNQADGQHALQVVFAAKVLHPQRCNLAAIDPVLDDLRGKPALGQPLLVIAAAHNQLVGHFHGKGFEPPGETDAQ